MQIISDRIFKAPIESARFSVSWKIRTHATKAPISVAHFELKAKDSERRVKSSDGKRKK